jgi:hypothetical protein
MTEIKKCNEPSQAANRVRGLTGMNDCKATTDSVIMTVPNLKDIKEHNSQFFHFNRQNSSATW